ncbi:MAG: hypothetical protein M3Q66_02295 [Chloroflexota bacterium]|nr:hypothetical protein [Chloroflexota bacterium]
MIRRAVVGVALAALAAGGLAGCATSCPAALQPGVLVADGPASLGLRDTSNQDWHVRWPFGVSVRLDGERLVLTDLFGTVIAHEGDAVSLPGGTADDEIWGVCGDIQIDGRQAEP